MNISSYSHKGDISFYKNGQLQDFYGIIYNGLIKEETPILLINGITEFWKKNKDFWFSHAPINYKSLKMIGTMYEKCKNFNIALLLHYDQIIRHPCQFLKNHHY